MPASLVECSAPANATRRPRRSRRSRRTLARSHRRPWYARSRSYERSRDEKERIAEDFCEIGLALAQISNNELYVALGRKSFDEMLKVRDLLRPTTARSLVQLVGGMSRDDALACRQERAIMAGGNFQMESPWPPPPWAI